MALDAEKADRARTARRDWLARRLSGHGQAGHALFAKVMNQLGHERIYTVPGIPVYEPLQSSGELGIQLIGTRHQFSAAVAAAAENYVAGGLRAAAMVSAGPAVTNLATGLLYARENSIPLIAIGGRRGLRSAQHGEFQEMDGMPFASGLTKKAALIDSARSIHPALRAAAGDALSCRRGPVYLDIAQEALAESAAPSSWRPVEYTTDAGPDDSDLEQVANLLRNAKRPAVLAGCDLRWGDAPSNLCALLETVEAPCVTTSMARGIVPDDHRMVFNQLGERVQAEADVVLVLGTNLDWQFRFGAQIHQTATIILIGHDLAAASDDYSPAIRIPADPGRVLRSILDRLRSDSGSDTAKTARSIWLRTLRAESEVVEATAWADAISCGDYPSTSRLLYEIRNFLSRDAITVLDANLTMLAAQKIIPCHIPGHRLTAGINGTMGVGLPLALGAKLARPSQTVVAICGDFAFGFSCAEFETAVRHRIPVITVVVDNGGLNAGSTQRSYFNADSHPIAVFHAGVRFNRLTEAFGGYGEFVERTAEIRPALERAESSGLPSILHVRVAG